MKRQLLLILLALHTFTVHAQSTFQRTYGSVGNDGVDLIEINNLNTAILSGSSKGLKLVSMDQTGKIKRTVYYKDITSLSCKRIFQLKNGDFMISGFISRFSSNGSIIMRTDSTGNVLWSKSYTSISHENVVLKTLKQTYDGGFIAVGETDYNTKGLIVKLDPTGNVVWKRKIGFNQDDYSCLDVIQSEKDSSFLVLTMSLQVGHTNNYGMLSKFDKTGTYKWSKILSSPMIGSELSFYQLTERHNGKLQFCYNNTVLIEFDKDGNNARQLELHEYAYITAWQPSQSKDNGYLITGSCSGDILVAEVDSLGNYKWGKRIGGIKVEESSCIKQLSDKSIVIGGYTENFTLSDYATYIVKMDSTGSASCNHQPFIASNTSFSPIAAAPRNPAIDTTYFVQANLINIQGDWSLKDSTTDACGGIKPVAEFITGNSGELKD